MNQVNTVLIALGMVVVIAVLLFTPRNTTNDLEMHLREDMRRDPRFTRDYQRIIERERAFREYETFNKTPVISYNKANQSSNEGPSTLLGWLFLLACAVAFVITSLQ